MLRALMIALCLFVLHSSAGPNLSDPRALSEGNYIVYANHGKGVDVWDEKSIDGSVVESVGYLINGTVVHTLGGDIVAPGGVYIHIDFPIRGYIWWSYSDPIKKQFYILPA